MKEWKDKYIAHRGLHDDNSRENSLSAFLKAIELGIAIELDVRLLKDDTVVVFHDDNLYRMTGVNKDVSECTYEDIKNIYLLGTKEKIPLFTDALELISGKVLIDIELKSDSRRGLLEEKVTNILDSYQGRFLVKSFSPYTVWWFKRRRPQYKRGLLLSSRQKNLLKVLLSNFSIFCLLKPNFLAVPLDIVSYKKIQKYRKKYLVFVWTIRSKEELSKIKTMADAYIFEKFKPY